MAYDQSIKDYAKSLYLTIDEDGQQVESERSIAGKCKIEFGKNIGKDQEKLAKNIHNWITKGNWKAELEDIKNEFRRRLRDQQKASEEQAKKDREKKLGLASTTYEIKKVKIDKGYNLFHEIAVARAEFTLKYLNRQFDPKTNGGYTMEEIENNMCTPQQEVAYLKVYSEASSSQDEQLVDNAMTIIHQIIQPPMPQHVLEGEIGNDTKEE